MLEIRSGRAKYIASITNNLLNEVNKGSSQNKGGGWDGKKRCCE